MAKLHFRYGAMGSTKTAQALMLHYNFQERNRGSLLLKPSTDTRDGETIIKSRCGMSSKCLLFEKLTTEIAQGYEILIIDESQFLNLKDIKFLIELVDNYDITVVCYGLRTDFQGELFEGSKYLLAWADDIEEIKTICKCGNKATRNARLGKSNKVVKEGEQVVLGGNEKYIPMCRKCFDLS
jgi:thymidine kinase